MPLYAAGTVLAVFSVLSLERGELEYVNCRTERAHLVYLDQTRFLESTGMPLGLIPEALFQSQTVIIPRRDKLLLFTDGLTDGIGGENRMSASVKR